MSDQMGSPSGRNDILMHSGPSANGTVTWVHGGCEEVIRAHLLRQWLNEESGDDCFDANTGRMEVLLSFIGDTSSAGEATDVRKHLLTCSRCRYIFARLRDGYTGDDSAASATQHAAESIPSLLAAHLRSIGPVVFPDGEVANGAWEFGLLNELAADDADRISDAIAERAFQKLRAVVPRKELVLVCFSQPLHRIGKRFAAKLVRVGATDLHVVMADDFFSPKLWCDPKELKDRDVLVFVDVVHSGGLLNRLLEVCRRATPRSLAGVAVIDQSRSTVANERLHALWTEKPERRSLPVPAAPAEVRFFDPVAARAYPNSELPIEVADPARARETIEQHLREIGPRFKGIIAETEALRRDARIGGVTYPWAVDILRLLANDEGRKELEHRTAHRLSDLAAQGPWCVVYPAERHQRAGAWASVVASAFGWPVVGVGLHRNSHYRRLTSKQRDALEGRPRALIVDAAIRTGRTLQSLTQVLRSGAGSPPPQIAAFYAFDGLFAQSRREMEEQLGVGIGSLFRLPLGAPTKPVGRHCRARLSETLEELEKADSSRGKRGWVEVVRRYCRKKLSPSARPANKSVQGDVERSLRLAFDEGERGAEARLEHACDPPRPSLVKHLDVEFALREPRTRNVLHGFLCNSMPPEFIEWCALALSTQEEYDWLDRDWLLLHKKFFTNAASERWQFLACVGYWVRQRGDAEQLNRIRVAVSEFRATQTRPTTLPLFPDSGGGTDQLGVLADRCETLLSVLSSE